MTTEHDFVPISPDEARSFLRHAHVGAKHDLEGEGVEYSLIQPYDLERMALTILLLTPKTGDHTRYSASPLGDTNG